MAWAKSPIGFMAREKGLFSARALRALPLPLPFGTRIQEGQKRQERGKRQKKKKEWSLEGSRSQSCCFILLVGLASQQRGKKPH